MRGEGLSTCINCKHCFPKADNQVISSRCPTCGGAANLKPSPLPPAPWPATRGCSDLSFARILNSKICGSVDVSIWGFCVLLSVGLLTVELPFVC